MKKSRTSLKASELFTSFINDFFFSLEESQTYNRMLKNVLSRLRLGFFIVIVFFVVLIIRVISFLINKH